MRVRNGRHLFQGLLLPGFLLATMLAATFGTPAALATLEDPVPIPPGEIVPFNRCGVLTNDPDGDGCWYFETHNGGVYTIEFTGSFGHGDRVCVSGQAIAPAECLLGCASAAVTGCIVNNTIEAGFVGPGTIEFGPQLCPYFASDEGDTYVLDHYGEFGDGDRVFVAGRVETDSDICPSPDVTAIVNNSIEPYFEQCVTVGPSPQGCVMVHSNGEAYAVIGSLGGAGLGEEVHVSGVVIPNSNACELVPGPAIVVMDVRTCNPTPDLPGDVNGDGLVNFGDILVVISQWGICVNQCPGDVNNDGNVNFSDILFVLSHWTN
ncbi:MAG: hypothetical protein ACYTGP_03900 [Planctomycetota bacterium]|jgi:hypothetical protein